MKKKIYEKGDVKKQYYLSETQSKDAKLETHP